ncbi:MAG TPA: sigma 54-interacting transcriptional regulator [Candidatus Kapabacteria bacterium]|nr:sigma 54-interacting transcriptional regulator [Candidatus Kapabacteria bacterium]
MPDTDMLPSTLGALKASGYTSVSVKEEMRRNLIRKLRAGEEIFPGIVGFEQTVIPQLINAILARHDIILLGLRGQAKTRIARLLPTLLDEYIPIVAGSEINDNPFAPVSSRATLMIREMGDETPIEWIGRSVRYGEKLATPDVTIADLIGDIDPIKAANQRLSYSHEGAIHFGLIPRTNRGIFVINELPDLQPRIQVGLFNIMQEKDIQIRGFNIRIPLDLAIIFTANPEDYTNRGSIITPLKDRIDSQILTHYPRTLEDGMAITRQESWRERGDLPLVMPSYLEQIVEMIAVQARSSEFVDQQSGVSARMTIATIEALVSNAERRAIVNGEREIVPRIVDLQQALPGITGKVELVFEGEQEGPAKVARLLINKGVREVFALYFPNPSERPRRSGGEGGQKNDPYARILKWFGEGNTIELEDTMSFDEYINELYRVPGLSELAIQYMKVDPANLRELATAMEFLLDGLHQYSKVAKEEVVARVSYKDMLGTIFTIKGGRFDDEREEYE